MEAYEEWKAEQARPYFNHIRSLMADVRVCRSSIEAVREIERGIDYTRPRVSSSAYRDAIPDVVSKLMALEDEYRDEVERMLEERREAEAIIEGLSRDDYRRVLTYYYLNELSWSAVADEKHMDKDIRWCRRLGKQALAESYALIPREWRTCVPHAL